MTTVVQRICQHCERPFERAPRSRAIFCSPTCARSRHLEQQRKHRGQEPRAAARLAAAPGYTELAAVLDEALAQAQSGKGIERHGCGEPFVDQQIVQLGEWMGGCTVFAVGQAAKKAIESTRLDDDRARGELLGAIAYLAAAVLVIDRRRSVP